MREEHHGASRPGHRLGNVREAGVARLVSVGELIRRQPESLRAKLPRRDPPGEEHHEPSGRGPTSGEPAPLRPSVRLAAGAAALCLLAGAVSATSVLLSRATTSPGAGSVTRAEGVTGMTALRPDLLLARAGLRPVPVPEVPGSASPGPVLPLPGLPVPGSDEDGGGRDERGPDGSQRQDSASLVRANPSAGSTQGAVDLVKDFYRLLDGAPSRATELLAPRLLGAQAEEFTGSWNAMEHVRARRVRPGSDGSVVAEVTVRSGGGAHMRLRHELTVEKASSTPRIVTVELLAAELHRG